MTKKEYDVVVWGASGFTGRLVAGYLLKQYGTGNELRWAMAGRNRMKLEQIRKELDNETIPIEIADSNDRESLEKLVSKTEVICSTVGPYAKYGSLLVEICVSQGTAYCDLTGEVQWIRRMIDQFHEKAQQNKARIVHCCGFDSIPSDLGVFYLQQEARERYQQYCVEVKFRMKAAKGGFSGGTLASLDNVMAEAKHDKKVMEVLANPYGLNPDGDASGPDGRDLNKVAYDEDFKAWLAPFVMGPINTKVVRRSHALAGFPYGKEFRYDEATLIGPGTGGKIKAGIMAGVMGGLTNPDSLLKKIATPLLPKPGEGPSKQQQENGFFAIALLGKLEDGTTIHAKVTGDRDPGYGATSKMLAESAVCLAKDTLPETYGILTPSTAMGKALLTRLQTNAGVSFSIPERKSD